VSVNISTPPRLQDGEWAYEDLELDVVKIGENQAFVEDEDEFAEACAVGLISTVEAEHARTCTTDVAGLLSAGMSPFDYSLWRRLEVAIELGLPSLSQ
jgi:predicted RNA-binding protein associated with RNAse of E/G family